MRLITDTEWARMSWHARQRYIAHLARLRRELHAELETTQGALAAATVIEAKRMLRRAAVSSDGAARIEAALLEVYGPAKRRKGRPLTEVDAVIVQRLKDGEAVGVTPQHEPRADEVLITCDRCDWRTTRPAWPPRYAESAREAHLIQHRKADRSAL